MFDNGLITAYLEMSRKKYILNEDSSSFLMSLFYSSSVSSAQEQQQYLRSRQIQGRDEQSASWRRPDSEPHRRIRITT
jgi:hypothetical protein